MYGVPIGALNGVIGAYQGGQGPLHGGVGPGMGVGTVMGIGWPIGPQGDMIGMGWTGIG